MDVNLPDITWSEPVKALVEKISTAIGAWWEPRQIVRVAKAEAERDRIRAESQIQISELERRALNRFIAEETKKQQNMEAIIQQALPQVEENADPGKIEDDWIFNFFDKCRLISDTEMQSLWSRILAGEANSPGSFSKRIVNVLASLDKRDAQIFTQLCTFAWEIRGQVVSLVYEPEDELYEKHGITAHSLRYLDDIGLIEFNNKGSFRISYKAKNGLPINCTVFYYKRATQIELSGKFGYIEVAGHVHYTLATGFVRLTKVGQELAPICGSTPDEEFRNYVLTKWKQWGHIKEEMAETGPS